MESVLIIHKLFKNYFKFRKNCFVKKSMCDVITRPCSNDVYVSTLLPSPRDIILPLSPPPQFLHPLEDARNGHLQVEPIPTNFMPAPGDHRSASNGDPIQYALRMRNVGRILASTLFVRVHMSTAMLAASNALSDDHDEWPRARTGPSTCLLLN